MKKHSFLEAGRWVVGDLQKDRGVTLVESMIAVMVAMIGVFGLGTLIFQATVTNKNQGTEVTRATIFAQDKMELLLSYGSSGAINTATANFATCTQGIFTNPAICNSSAITDMGWNTGLMAGGPAVTSGIVINCPASGLSVGYVDYLDTNGRQIAGTCANVATVNPAYVRMWEIKDVPATGGPAVKQISVGVWSQAAVTSTAAGKPVVVLTSYMSNPN